MARFNNVHTSSYNSYVVFFGTIFFMVDLMMFVGIRILWCYLTVGKIRLYVSINLAYTLPAYKTFNVNLISLPLFFVKW